MKYAVLLFFTLYIFFDKAHSADQEGYILKSGVDTVWGKVDVQMKKVIFGKKEIDFADMNQEIEFTENGGKSKNYKAGEIAGFGFNNSGMWFHYVVLDWSANTWKKSLPGFSRKVREGKYFINRVEDGAVPLYKFYYKVTSTTIGSSGTSKSESSESELYIMSAGLGYVEVAPASFSANKKLKEFLMKYLSMEEDFLKTVDDKAKFSDAEEILKTYNEWKRRN